MFIYYIGFGLIILSLLMLLFTFIVNLKPKEITLKSNNSKNFAVLIPARDESNVIEELLKSIQEQTDLKNTYVIVEKATDKTVRIANKYGANVYVRKVTKDTKRKGYALDECLKDILKRKKHYDLYFIIDADNVLDKNFFKELLRTYNKGYQIGCGYRNIKNNDNVYATCSGLTFTFINHLYNRKRNKTHKTKLITGTGFYVDGKLIEEWKGFPFHSLTEDYELTMYCYDNNISTYYNQRAIFYDEQPTSFKTSMVQRTRWIKGFFEVRKKEKYKNKNDLTLHIGIIPFILFVTGILLITIYSLFLSLFYFILLNPLSVKYFVFFILSLLGVYIVLFIITYVIIIKNIEKLNMHGQDLVKALFFNPIFMASYLLCGIKALTEKDDSWQVIEHDKHLE